MTPEVPRIFMDGGVSGPFWAELVSDRESDIEFSQTIQKTRRALEEAFTVVARQSNVDFVFCDRGLPDNGTYLQDGENYEELFGASLEQDLDRYDYVIHLGSARSDEQRQYSDPDEARLNEIEQRTSDIWSQHPNYKFFPIGGGFAARNRSVLSYLQTLEPGFKKLSSSRISRYRYSKQEPLTGLQATNVIEGWIPPRDAFEVLGTKDLFTMLVSGPSYETAFHHNPSPEVLVQLVGSAEIEYIEGDEFKRLELGEGSAIVFPANVPHRPIRGAGTKGLVVERVRDSSELEFKAWYCRECMAQILIFEIDEKIPNQPMEFCKSCFENTLVTPKLSTFAASRPLQETEELSASGLVEADAHPMQIHSYRIVSPVPKSGNRSIS